MDRLTKEQRSKVMQAVKSKDTSLEKRLRKLMWAKGFRYRKNYSPVFGKPDIAIPSLKIAIFCDSEFWHGYNWRKRKYDIKSNRQFWWPKIEKNIKRDLRVTTRLKAEGWTVLRFWEPDLNKNLEVCLGKIEQVVGRARVRMSRSA